jgi:hypothetical protein
MSEFFVKKFKEKHECGQCDTSKVTNYGKTYSMCLKHLNKARNLWRNWATVRRTAGKCCYCDKKSYNGWLRCREHTKSNRAKCRAWYMENKAYRAEYSVQHKLSYLAQGKCPQCPEHRSLQNGYTRCQTCRCKNRNKLG